MLLIVTLNHCNKILYQPRINEDGVKSLQKANSGVGRFIAATFHNSSEMRKVLYFSLQQSFCEKVKVFRVYDKD